MLLDVTWCYFKLLDITWYYLIYLGPVLNATAKEFVPSNSESKGNFLLSQAKQNLGTF